MYWICFSCFRFHAALEYDETKSNKIISHQFVVKRHVK